jgi:hypothetical protein
MATSLRKRQLREDARDLLEKFIYCVWVYSPWFRSRHFKPQIQKFWDMGLEPNEEEWRASLIKPSQGTDKDDLDLDKELECSDSFFRILLAVQKEGLSAEDIIGIENDLLNLTLALNQKIGPIEFRPRKNRIFGGEGPWGPANADRIRAGADLLLRYLNRVYKCGPVHAVCEGCAGLMTTAPGKPKKYCTPQCRWPSDDERRKYFRDMQARRRAAIKGGAKRPPKRRDRKDFPRRVIRLE